MRATLFFILAMDVTLAAACMFGAAVGNLVTAAVCAWLSVGFAWSIGITLALLRGLATPRVGSSPAPTRWG